MSDKIIDDAMRQHIVEQNMNALAHHKVRLESENGELKAKIERLRYEHWKMEADKDERIRELEEQVLRLSIPDNTSIPKGEMRGFKL